MLTCEKRILSILEEFQRLEEKVFEQEWKIFEKILCLSCYIEWKFLVLSFVLRRFFFNISSSLSRVFSSVIVFFRTPFRFIFVQRILFWFTRSTYEVAWDSLGQCEMSSLAQKVILLGQDEILILFFISCFRCRLCLHKSSWCCCRCRCPPSLLPFLILMTY